MSKIGEIYVKRESLVEYRYGDLFTCAEGVNHAPSPEQLDSEGYKLPIIPTYDPITEELGSYIDDGQDIIREVIAKPEAEVALYMEAKLNSDIDRLWQTAHDYEYSQISGSAIGMLVIGVLQELPKSLAVKEWINSIWVLYYERKAIVTNGGEADLDFTVCGSAPYSVPELMAEINY